MDVLEALPAALPIAAACRALGASRATLYRHTSPPSVADPTPARTPPRKLSDDERAEVLAVMHQERFVDQPPAEVYGALLSEGIFLCSVRTMYRLLAASGETDERRAQRAAHPHAAPELIATAPNEVWTWDITKLAGPVAGVFFYAYVIVDLFSRYIVGWLLAEKENAKLATQFIADTVRLHGIDPDALTLHCDRGSPMKADSMAKLCAKLGVAQSFSRPRVSNDNAFSESQFRTMKYQPDYPGRFGSPLHARGWLEEFVDWHNDHHHHEGLALFTPADVFFGRVAAVAAKRQSALDAAYAAHPERFVRGRPVAELPAATVTINVPLSPDGTPAKPSALTPDDAPSPPAIAAAQGACRAAEPASDPATRPKRSAGSSPPRSSRATKASPKASPLTPLPSKIS
jgi:putative transposase